MKEYIEREALMGKQWACRIADIDGETYGDLRDIADFIAEFPAADVVERKRGEWINEPPYHTGDGRYLKAQICSCCRAFYVSDGNTQYSNHNFCANCGADMRNNDYEKTPRN